MACLFDRLLRYCENSGCRKVDQPARRRRTLALEALEERLTPSGETVSAAFAAIPVQKTVQVSFDAVISVARLISSQGVRARTLRPTVSVD